MCTDLWCPYLNDNELTVKDDELMWGTGIPDGDFSSRGGGDGEESIPWALVGKGTRTGIFSLRGDGDRETIPDGADRNKGRLEFSQLYIKGRNN